MVLSDITQRIKNASLAADSGAQSSVRQITLFDLLNTTKQRHKRQRKSGRVTVDKENENDENTSPCADEKQAKRICVGSPRRTRANYSPSTRNNLLLFDEPQEQPHRLSSLVSPTARTFRLQSVDEPQLTVLPLACKYSNSVKARGKLSLVDESGYISIFDTFSEQDAAPHQLATEGMRPIIKWKAHDNSVFDFEWGPFGDQIVTASADEMCKLWDVERQQVLGMFSGHTQTVRSVSWQRSSLHCFSTASRDGSIMVWDIRCNKTTTTPGEPVYRPVNTISGAHHDVRGSKKPTRNKHSVISGSVTAIKHLCHDANVIASAGSTNEIIKYWDMRMTAPIRSAILPTPIASSLLASATTRSRGIASLSIDPDGTRIYAACNDNSVYVHNALALGQPISRLEAPEFQCNSFNIGTSMSPCGSYLAAGSASGSVVIWELDRYGYNSRKTRAVLDGHGKEVGCVAWYPGKDRVQLATSGDDGTLRVWDLDPKLAEEGKADPMRKYCWGFSRIQQRSL
ncbi:hypothetical protein IWW48_003100 [Coemansia sp. RSA 1200]|nr:hypothetical protein IWW48_003100 [Coemansia sp. RSA 1200]